MGGETDVVKGRIKEAAGVAVRKQKEITWVTKSNLPGA